MTIPQQVEHPTVTERTERGREARRAVAREAHAEWSPAPHRRGPVAILQEQASTRVPELVPVRHRRMIESPFTFYRGGAAIMAADLAGTPDSGLRVQCCGDAHLANFGGFAAPDRTIVFDVNDFDETLPGPWEWDLKRLAASFEIAGRSRGFDEKVRRRSLRRVVRSYRETMAEVAAAGNLDVWYLRVDEHDVVDRFATQLPGRAMDRYERGLTKARAKDSLKAFSKLAEPGGDGPRIISSPPLVERLEDLMGRGEADATRELLHTSFRVYRETLDPSRRQLVDQFRLVDIARKVVGVGSVGTRCWIVLMLGRDDTDPLFLQIKEAEASVLEPFVGASTYDNHGQRVVEGQRLLQSASDTFLGWMHAPRVDGGTADYYVRQLWDGKFSPAIDVMEPEVFEVYAALCGEVLARGHARTGDRVAIAAYLGKSDALDRAIAKFAVAYADQNERDHAEVVAAVADGVLEAAPAAE